MNISLPYDSSITLSNTAGTNAAGFEFKGWSSVNTVNNTMDIGAKGSTRQVNWPSIVCPGTDIIGSCTTKIYTH